MILKFSDEEQELIEKWVDTKSFGWPIREDCPPDIRKKLEEKLSLFDTKENKRE